MLASVRSATLHGIDGQIVRVEVHVANGLPAYSIVGLPDAAGRESKDRVRAAMISSQIDWPLRRITVNLAPGGVRKSGAGLELAVALGLMLADGSLGDGLLDGVGVLGELGLDGRIRPVPGALALVDALARDGATAVIVPMANAAEAALVPVSRQSWLSLASSVVPLTSRSVQSRSAAAPVDSKVNVLPYVSLSESV